MNMQALKLFTMAIAVTTPTLASAQPGPGYEQHMMSWGGGGYGMILGPIFMILVLAVVIAVAVLLVRWLGGSWDGQNQTPPAPTALDILKERYARGEIDKEEYEERRRILGE